MARPFTRHDLDTLLDRLSSAEASCQSIRENSSQFLNDLDNTNAEIQSVRNDVKSLQRYGAHMSLWNHYICIGLSPSCSQGCQGTNRGPALSGPRPSCPSPRVHYQIIVDMCISTGTDKVDANFCVQRGCYYSLDNKTAVIYSAAISSWSR